jgi:hypothetical protein
MKSAVLLAPTASEAARAAQALAEQQRGLRLRPYSFGGFLRSRTPPSAVVLYPGERSLGQSVEFLRRVRRRLLWPLPSRDVLAAVSGLISRDDLAGGFGGAESPPLRARPPVRRLLARASAKAGRGGEGGKLASALLLEGEVTADRAREVLASRFPREWIVESARHVRLSESEVEEIRKRGVRWRTLEPVAVLALAASPALARSRTRWKGLLPARTPVWTLPGRGRASSPNPSRRSFPRRKA